MTDYSNYIIKQIDIETGLTVQNWDCSIRKIAEETGYSYTSIDHAVLGKRPSYNGFIWTRIQKRKIPVTKRAYRHQQNICSYDADRPYRIYCYTNQITGLKYIGCTKYRFESQRAGKNGLHYIGMCSKFGEAIQQFGWDNFKYEILENHLTKDQSEDREKYWISELNTLWPNGYNLESGGKNQHGCHSTTRKKMSDTRQRTDFDYSHLINPEAHSKASTGRIWSNDGKRNYFHKYIPEGCVPGIIKKV